jgi:hypothetical protein
MRKLNEILNPVMARAHRAAERDPVWAVWQYDAETWRRYDEWAWGRAQRRTLLFVAIVVAWGVLWMFLFGAMFNEQGWIFGDLLSRWGWVIIAVAAVVWGGLPYLRSRRLHQARQRGLAEIRIGPVAITEPGGAISICGSGWNGGIVGLDALSPPMHTLRAVRIESGYPGYVRFSGWGGRSWPTSVYVPIPLGQEGEAAALVARFQQEILYQPAPPVYPYQQPPAPNLGYPSDAEISRDRPARSWVGGTPESQRYGRQPSEASQPGPRESTDHEL